MIVNYSQGLLGSVIIISLFCVFHLVVFQKETAFKQNRFFLLLGILLSITLPFIEFSEPLNLPIPSSVFLLDMIIVSADKIITVEPQTNINVINILFVIYLTGTIILLGRFILQVIQILGFFKTDKVLEKNGIKIIYTGKKHAAFSFLRFIFIDIDSEKSKDLEVIIKHEMIHVLQHHTVDLLLFELLLIIQWFNPLVWIYGKKIKENHEFLVDKNLIGEGVDTIEYQRILLSTYSYFNYDLVNNFNHSLTFKRLIMMTKNKSKASAIVKLIAILPILFISVYVVSCSDNNKVDATKKPTKEVVLKQFVVTATNDTIFNFVESPAEFPGGNKALMEYLSTNIQYPKEAQEAGIEGMVFMSFVINKQGEVGKIEILRGLDNSLDKEAVRVVKSFPKWTPGKHKGKVVSTFFRLPIKFKLS